MRSKPFLGARLQWTRSRVRGARVCLVLPRSRGARTILNTIHFNY